MMSNAFRSIGSYVSLRSEEASCQHTNPLVHPPSSAFFLNLSPCSSCTPLPSLLHVCLLLLLHLPPPALLFLLPALCCDAVMCLFTARLLPVCHHSILAVSPLFLLLFHVPSCSYTEASVSACLPVANKVSPLFVGASFWRGRPSSKLIVHSLAFACRNLTT